MFWQGNLDSGSSSSSFEASFSEMSAQMIQPSHFYQLEALAFLKLQLSFPATLPQLPIVLERVDLTGLSASSVPESLTTDNSASDANPLAIVPYQPSLHAVLISLWASAQADVPPSSDNVPMDVELQNVNLTLQVSVGDFEMEDDFNSMVPSDSDNQLSAGDLFVHGSA